MPIIIIEYPVMNFLFMHDEIVYFRVSPSQLCSCCTCRSRDKGVVSFIYAAALATKGAPLCRQSWKNEAKSRPIDRPRVATSLPSATGRITWAKKVRSFLAARTLIYPVGTVQLKRRVCRPCTVILREPTTFDTVSPGDVA